MNVENLQVWNANYNLISELINVAGSVFLLEIPLTSMSQISPSNRCFFSCRLLVERKPPCHPPKNPGLETACRYFQLAHQGNFLINFCHFLSHSKCVDNFALRPPGLPKLRQDSD